ncbi:MAG: ATP-dependent helicase HrpA [Planctomycetes bacterium]|nr:ATP-dependent helicase HrpA [Planctomycetota bacterium]
MKRVFLADALRCGNCGGQRRLLTFVSDQFTIQRILHHLGLPVEPPELAPARAPPRRSVHFVRS